MSDQVKIVSIGAVAILFILVLFLTPGNTAMLDKLFVALCLVIGIPLIANGVWTLMQRKQEKKKQE